MKNDLNGESQAQGEFEDGHDTRCFRLSEGYQNERLETTDKNEIESAQWKPTKPTDEETKAAIRKVLSTVAAEHDIVDEARIEASVEEMFIMMKKSFG